MKSPGLLALVLLFSPMAAAAPRLEPGFWNALTRPDAQWLLEERMPAPGTKPAKVRVETYDCRAIAGASVARLRWTQILESGSKDIGDSDQGRYTQVAVTVGGIYLLSSDMDDAMVATALKRKPSRSDPPRAYSGSSRIWRIWPSRGSRPWTWSVRPRFTGFLATICC